MKSHSEVKALDSSTDAIVTRAPQTHNALSTGGTPFLSSTPRLNKHLALFAAAILVVCLALPLAGCGSNGNSIIPSTAEIENPVVEVDSLDTVNEELTINLVLPGDVSPISFEIIDSSLGEATFSRDGQIFNYRGMVTATEEDTSGLYYDFSSHETGEAGGLTYTLELTNGGPGSARWYDVGAGISYSLSVDNGASSALLGSVASELIALQR